MSSSDVLSRKEILMHIIGAGINISPNALNILAEKEMKNQDIEDLIRQISFISTFKSHITIEFLKQTNLLNEEEIPINKKEKKEINKKPKKKEKSKKIINSESDSLNQLSNLETKNSNTKKKVEKAEETKRIKNLPENITSSIKENLDKGINDIDSSIINEEKTTQEEESHRVKDIIEKSIKLENIGGLSKFKPIAKEFSEQIKIIEDPTKNIYTSASNEDFINLVKDKFNKLKEILKKHPDVVNLVSIRHINSLQDSTDVSFVGMVSKKQETGEKRHIKITLEDPTGEIDAIVVNNENNSEIYKKLIYLLNDQVVYISGGLSVDTRRKSRIVFINNIIWPDIPVGYKPVIPECPVSIAFISDVHIGSKNFMPKLFDRFIKYLNCELGNEKARREAGKIKYLVIGGDLIDGIGVYPNQDKELNITDIYEQYKRAEEWLSKIPEYIKIIYIPGNHEPVRKALPLPIVPMKYCQNLKDMGVIMSGNPSTMSLHGLKLLCYHGDSIIDLIMNIPGLKNENPEESMKEFLRCRHLAPIYGAKTEIAPTSKDWLVINEIPHIFHTGHVHINGMATYHNVLNINSGCFQSQTSFMKSLGIIPTPGYPIVITPEKGKLNYFSINLNQ
ncbi:MAG: DNA-directed DNA polymerase II small subunit [archaeon]|nr:DNA-directed DNA polymerase II small subunit [archaeon]